jgi:hypothetical protein
MLFELLGQQYPQYLFYLVCTPELTLPCTSSQSKWLIQIEILPNGELRDLGVLGLRQIRPCIRQGLWCVRFQSS